MKATIKLKIKDKTIEMSLEELKEFKDELDKIFGNNRINYYPIKRII